MSLAYVDVPRDGDPKSGNCPPGFVADNGIDNPLAPDFFIQSHGGLLGSEFKEIYLWQCGAEFMWNSQPSEPLHHSQG